MIFNRHWHTEQRQLFPFCAPTVRVHCGIAGAVKIAHDDGIDRAIELFDARDRLVDQFHGRNFAALEFGGHGLRAPIGG